MSDDGASAFLNTVTGGFLAGAAGLAVLFVARFLERRDSAKAKHQAAIDWATITCIDLDFLADHFEVNHSLAEDALKELAIANSYIDFYQIGSAHEAGFRLPAEEMARIDAGWTVLSTMTTTVPESLLDLPESANLINAETLKRVRSIVLTAVDMMGQIKGVIAFDQHKTDRFNERDRLNGVLKAVHKTSNDVRDEIATIVGILQSDIARLRKKA